MGKRLDVICSPQANKKGIIIREIRYNSSDLGLFGLDKVKKMKVGSND